MAKIIKLTESDLRRIVKKVIKEQNITKGVNSIGKEYNIDSPYKTGQILMGKRSTDNQNYKIQVVKVGQGWISAKISGPGTYQGKPIASGEWELTTNVPGQVSGNMEMGTFKIIK